MPFDPEIDAAIERLQSYYNGDAYHATNPGGMGEGGHRQNFEPALSDVGITGEAVGSAADIMQTQSDDVATRSTEFRSRFLGAAATPPSQDGNGDPVADGAIYWDSNTDTLRVYSNGTWEAPAAAATDYVPASTGGTFAGAVNAAGGLTGDLIGNVTGNVTGDLAGNVVGDVTGNVSGNAGTATALQTARTITINGAVDASASFDGTGDITLTAAVDDNSHNHLLSNITDAGTMAAQDASAVDIDGGAIDGVAIGEAARSTAKVTTLDADDAATFGTTLDVTGAATLSSTLGVTGAATFTAQTVHSAGINTNLVQGADGSLVLNADAGDNIEIQVDGVKKAEITAEGDVIAAGRLQAGVLEHCTVQITSQPTNGSDFGNLHFSPLVNDDGLYNSGVIELPTTGFWDMHLSVATSTGTATISIQQSVDGGSNWSEIALAGASGVYGGAGSIHLVVEASGSMTQLKLVSASGGSTNISANGSWWTIARRG